VAVDGVVEPPGPAGSDRPRPISSLEAMISTPVRRDDAWLRAARTARWLSWASLLWMTAEGALGIYAGVSAGSIALVGWALSSAVEGLAAVIVIWRFTGSRTLSGTAEGRAQKAVATSLFLLAPAVALESVRNLVVRHEPGTTVLGMALTATSLVLMPGLGVAKQRLGARLGSNAAAGEGTQNLLCAALAGAVLAGLAANTWLGWWWVDPVVGLVVAVVAIREGVGAWRGEGCGCAAAPVPGQAASGCGPACTDSCCAGESPARS
jgi:divalent metal cation (Fe/Co/Zn/Cd) transporter